MQIRKPQLDATACLQSPSKLNVYVDEDDLERLEVFAVVHEYCLESRSRGILYMRYVNGRRNGLVTFCVETAFYNGLLKER